MPWTETTGTAGTAVRRTGGLTRNGMWDTTRSDIQQRSSRRGRMRAEMPSGQLNSELMSRMPGGIPNHGMAGGMPNHGTPGGTVGGMQNHGMPGGMQNHGTAGGMQNHGTVGGMQNHGTASGMQNHGMLGGMQNHGTPGGMAGGMQNHGMPGGMPGGMRNHGATGGMRNGDVHGRMRNGDVHGRMSGGTNDGSTWAASSPPALGTETSVQRPGATFQKALPEYLTAMASRIKRARADSRAQLGIAAPHESRQTDATAQTETPPHLIPFQAQGLTLNLAPPHGSMPPPQRQPLLHRRR